MRTERPPGVWHVGGLENNGVGCRGGVETATEGVRRFLAARGKEEEDAARHREKKREVNKTRNVVVVHGRVEPAKRHNLVWLMNRRNSVRV